jgi:hypothetical protein
VSTSSLWWRGVVPAVLMALTLLLGTACAPKSPDRAVWTDQARHAVTDVQGEVATVELVLRQQRAGKLPQNYQQVVVLGSEEAIGTTAESFSSVQPPEGADSHYQRVTSVLSDASDLVAQTRIAIVREDTAEYPKLLRELGTVSDDLSKTLTELNTP